MYMWENHTIQIYVVIAIHSYNTHNNSNNKLLMQT